jgi:hypothetical protein
MKASCSLFPSPLKGHTKHSPHSAHRHLAVTECLQVRNLLSQLRYLPSCIPLIVCCSSTALLFTTCTPPRCSSLPPLPPQCGSLPSSAPSWLGRLPLTHHTSATARHPLHSRRWLTTLAPPWVRQLTSLTARCSVNSSVSSSGYFPFPSTFRSALPAC